MPNPLTTLERLRAILVEQLGVNEEDVKPETNFTELGADSLDRVEIVMAVEEDWDISIHEEEQEKLESAATVQNAVELIDQLVSEKK